MKWVLRHWAARTEVAFLMLFFGLI
ncbi:hypothetical protein DFAR_2160002 [Desulfarculales bacterium]